MMFKFDTVFDQHDKALQKWLNISKSKKQEQDVDQMIVCRKVDNNYVIIKHCKKPMFFYRKNNKTK